MNNIPDKHRRYVEEDRGHSSPCWVWYGPKDVHGYGFVSKGKYTKCKAHTYFYRMLSGEPPAGKVAHHLCEVKLCVNPVHIEWVTRAEHILTHMPKDPAQIGYSLHPRPQYRKVTPEGVEEIRQLYATGQITQSALGRRFGVTQTHIWRIVNGHTH